MTRYPLLYVGALLCPLLAFADEPVRTVSWPEAVTLAQENNPDLQSAAQARRAARARYRLSLNTLYPQLSLTNSYGESSEDREGTWEASGQASLDLFNLGNNAAIGSAAAAYCQSEASFRLQSVNLRLDLRRAFADLLFAQEQVAVATKVKEIRAENADLVTLKYDSGRESKGNMLRAKAERLEAEASLADAIRQLKVAKNELGRQIGLDRYENIVATGALAAAPRVEPENLDPWVETHPEVALRQAEKDDSSAGLRRAKSSLWPSLAANYTRSFSDRDYFPNEDPQWTASGVLSYRLFGAGPTATYYEVSAAKREVARAEQDLRSARQSVRAALESAWAEFAGRLDQLAVQSGFLAAARQRNEEARVRYSSGLMTFENWEIVVGDLVDFERSMIRARRDAVVAQAQWDRATGKLLEEQ